MQKVALAVIVSWRMLQDQKLELEGRVKETGIVEKELLLTLKWVVDSDLVND